MNISTQRTKDTSRGVLSRRQGGKEGGKTR